jgi:hypothetical protein
MFLFLRITHRWRAPEAMFSTQNQDGVGLGVGRGVDIHG